MHSRLIGPKQIDFGRFKTTYQELARATALCDREHVSEHQRHVRGERGAIPARAHPYKVEDVKRWRKAEYDAGRPSGLDDFFATHGICPTCRGEGVHMIGWSDPRGQDELRAARKLQQEQLPVYGVCPQCGGRGTSAKE